MSAPKHTITVAADYAPLAEQLLAMAKMHEDIAKRMREGAAALRPQTNDEITPP